MKAYKAWIDDDYQNSTVIFAENKQAAKVFAFNRSIIADSYPEYIDVRVRRIPVLDAEYRGHPEMDWDDSQDRLAMTKAGWTCHPDTFDPEYCGTCAGKEYCGEYEEYIQEAQYADV